MLFSGLSGAMDGGSQSVHGCIYSGLEKSIPNSCMSQYGGGQGVRGYIYSGFETSMPNSCKTGRARPAVKILFPYLSSACTSRDSCSSAPRIHSNSTDSASQMMIPARPSRRNAVS